LKTRTFGIAALAASLAMVALLAAACGDDDSSAATPSAAAPSSASTTTASPSAAVAYPVTVTDLLGRTVTIKAKPRAVVALSPTTVEFVYAAGGTVIGRTTTVDYPAAAKSATDVGSAYQPSMEVILGLKPDLIIADSVLDAQPNVRKPLEDSGIPVVFAGVDSYQKVLDGLALMGKVFDAQAVTAKVAADVTKARDDAKAAIAGKTVTALAMIADQTNTFYAAKENSYAGDIMKQLGLTNPAAGQPDAGPFPGYTSLAPEKVIQYDPDYIFAISPQPQPAPRLSAIIPQVPPFKGLKAVTTPGHLVEAPVELITSPGPRIIDAFKAIAAAVTGQKN
jgi:iron complex transport system substrate-binding protein